MELTQDQQTLLMNAYDQLRREAPEVQRFFDTNAKFWATAAGVHMGLSSADALAMIQKSEPTEEPQIDTLLLAIKQLWLQGKPTCFQIPAEFTPNPDATYWDQWIICLEQFNTLVVESAWLSRKDPAYRNAMMLVASRLVYTFREGVRERDIKPLAQLYANFSMQAALKQFCKCRRTRKTPDFPTAEDAYFFPYLMGNDHCPRDLLDTANRWAIRRYKEVVDPIIHPKKDKKDDSSKKGNTQKDVDNMDSASTKEDSNSTGENSDTTESNA